LGEHVAGGGTEASRIRVSHVTGRDGDGERVLLSVALNVQSVTRVSGS
jgi:hypothetical protein